MTDNELDAAIAREEAENQRLRTKLAESNTRLKIMREARRMARGEKPSKPKLSIADVVEDILRKAGKPLHMDDIVVALRKRSSYHQIAKETVTTALWRLAKQGRRFKNTAPNTFDLLK